MSGAYVAKAGLNYSLVMSLTGTWQTIFNGDAVDVTGSFRLNGTSRTVEPADKTITWTATLDGTPVNLRIEGVGDYAASVTSEASDSGVYWESSTSLEFEGIEGAASDQVLSVICSASIGGVDVSDYRIVTLPDLTLLVTGPSEVLFDAAASCTASFRADTTDKTTEPTEKTITWSATIDAVPVDLRIGAAGGYTSTVTSEVTDTGGFWQVTSSLEFDLEGTGAPRTLVVSGAGEIVEFAVNDTATITVPSSVVIYGTYSYNADLDGVIQIGSEDFWEIRISVATRLVSNNNLIWFKRWFIKCDRFDVVTQGVLTETNPENDPGDITLEVTTDLGSPPGPESNITMKIEIDDENPLHKYILDGDVVGCRTVSGTAEVTHTATILDESNGDLLDTDTQNDTFTQTGASASLKIEDETITRIDWSP